LWLVRVDGELDDETLLAMPSTSSSTTLDAASSPTTMSGCPTMRDLTSHHKGLNVANISHLTLHTGLGAMQPPLESVFGMHNWPYPETPSGTVGTRAGTILAGSGSFEITLTGAGGHAAGALLRTSTRPTLHRLPEFARLYEYSS